jgi:hypothetical protein
MHLLEHFHRLRVHELRSAQVEANLGAPGEEETKNLRLQLLGLVSTHEDRAGLENHGVPGVLLFDRHDALP